MIHVNVRAIIEREQEGETRYLIQYRTKPGEGGYELPGGRIDPYESMLHALAREVREETGLQITHVYGAESRVSITSGAFEVECIQPYAAYQTTKGPVDSFGVYFRCIAEGAVLETGDDTADIHWASREQLRKLIDAGNFGPVDTSAVEMLLK